MEWQPLLLRGHQCHYILHLLRFAATTGLTANQYSAVAENRDCQKNCGEELIHGGVTLAA